MMECVLKIKKNSKEFQEQREFKGSWSIGIDKRAWNEIMFKPKLFPKFFLFFSLLDSEVEVGNVHTYWAHKTVLG